ncbi:hypothetical protein DdX_16038 [Ditylenchus destructor]|uniref:F-box domain-containing protein n=1 Tax=Ditylenchus destructor TaxID=166010 RepID=A0AAD4MPA3_9BILA|nr:hypothetical protein DdX_16038 [Ditylenchus destructor]
MSYSKPLPPFTFDVLYYLNRDQLERFSIVCRPLKNLIERYFHSKPYRVFDQLLIHGGSYALVHNRVRWHPNRDDYSVQQFLGFGMPVILMTAELSPKTSSRFSIHRPFCSVDIWG